MVFSIILKISGVDYDFSPYILYDTIKRDVSLHTDLKANTNKLIFSVSRKCPYYDELLAANTPIDVTVTKDGAAYFKGYLTDNKNFEIVKYLGLDIFTLTAEDPGIKNLKAPWKSSNNVYTLWNDYKVCDSSSPSTSVVHAIAALAGVDVVTGIPTISSTVNLQIVDVDNKTYWDVLEKMLFEYGYVFFFDEVAKLNLYKIAKTTTTPTTTFSTQTNIRGNIKIKQILQKYQQATVEWDEWETLSNVVIHNDTTGATPTSSCLIPIPALGKYPNAEKSFIDYKLDSGKEIIAVKTANSDFTYDSGITATFTNLGKKGEILFTNTLGSMKNITKCKVIGGTVIAQKSRNFTTSNKGGKRVFKYKADYLHTSSEATELANTIQQYYEYCDNFYEWESLDNVALGSIVNVNDTKYTGLSLKVVIIGKIDRGSRGGEEPISYRAVGIDNFNLTAITSNVVSQPNDVNNPLNEMPTYSELQTGNLPIASNQITQTGGSIAGIQVNASSIYTGSGVYGNANTPFYAGNDGKFSLGGGLLFDGSTLIVNGSGTFSGTVTASSGSFTGTITTSNITATGGTVGGFTASSNTLTGGSLVFTNTGNIAAGTANDIVRVSADDATYRLWIGNATAASAPFRVTKAGAITATNISVTGGTVGGFTSTSSTLTGGSLVLANTGNITAGTSNDVIRVSANDATYRLWIGNATAASAPFRVTKAGAITATNISVSGGTIGGNTIDANGINSTNYIAGTSGFTIQNTGFAEFNNINVRGNVNSTSGSMGGWLITTDKLVSNATGGRIELNQAKSRISIFDSTGTEKVAMGYLSALAKNVGSGTWTDTDYGFWVSPGNSVVFDGTIEQKNSSFVATDSVIKIMAGATEAVRMGIDTAVNGLHLYHTSGKVSLLNSGTDQLRINTDGGYISIGPANTSWAHFNTDRANYHFDKGIHSVLGFTVYNTGYGIDSTGKAKFLSGTGADSDTVYIEDANGQLKERTIQNGVWSYNYNQNLLTTSTPTFSKVITSRLGLAGTYDSYQVQGFWSMGNAYVIDTANNHFGNLYGIAYAHTNAGTGVLGDTLKKPVAGEGHQLVFTNNGTANAMVSLSTGNFRTIGGFYGKVFPVNGTGADSNTVYIKDANGQLKERSLPTDAWTLNQPLLTTSTPTFAGINKTGSSDNYVLLGGSGHKLLSHIVSYNGWVASPGYDANTLDNNISFTYANNAPWTGPILNLNPNGYGLQLNANYVNGDRISFRTRNGDTTTWNGWKEFIHSGNIGSQNVDTVDGYHLNQDVRSTASPTFVNTTATYFIGTATKLQSGTANPNTTGPTYNNDGDIYIQYQ